MHIMFHWLITHWASPGRIWTAVDFDIRFLCAELNRSAVGIKLAAFSFDIVLFLHREQPAFCCLFNLVKTQLAPLFGWFLRTSSHINRQGNWKSHSIRRCKLGQSHYKDYHKNLQAAPRATVHGSSFEPSSTVADRFNMTSAHILQL